MDKIILILLLLTSLAYPQIFKVEKVNGTVKAQTGTDEKWIDVKSGMTVNAKTIIVTADNSSVQLTDGGKKFLQKESSAVTVAHLKKITLDELILALAMDNVTNSPKKKEDNKARSNPVYGEKEGKKPLFVESNDFGINKLNGAMQIAESGFKESAVVAAKETFRKYPGTNTIASFRIYFAGIIAELGLYDEAYEDFTSIKKLKLNESEKKQVENQLEKLSKKISSR